MTFYKKIKYLLNLALLNIFQKETYDARKFNRMMPCKTVYLAFKCKYPKAAFTKWRQIDVFRWQVTFHFKKEEHSALFSSEGKWLETITPVSLDITPKQVQQNFTGNYNNDGLQQIYHVETPEQSLYEISWNSGIYVLKLLYNSSGKIMSKMIS